MTLENILRGKEVRLTALMPSDVHTLVRWYQNDDFMRLFDARPAQPKTEAQLLEWMEERQKSTNAFLFAARPVSSDEMLGFLELEGIEWAHRTGWLSIAIGDRTNWGKGYGTSATELALKFAFHELNLHRVQLTVFSYNEYAIRLYEKLGFQREGTFREFLERDGQRYDMYLYGLLRPEWEERAASGKG